MASDSDIELIPNSDDISVNQILDALENKSYLNPKYCMLQELKNVDLVTNLTNFSSWFNDICKRELLRVDKEEADIYFMLLLQLKKNVNYALTCIGKSVNRNDRDYVCSICNEVIKVESYSDTWEALQNHEHFEAIYVNFLSGKTEVSSHKQTPKRIIQKYKMDSEQKPENGKDFNTVDNSLINAIEKLSVLPSNSKDIASGSSTPQSQHRLPSSSDVSKSDSASDITVNGVSFALSKSVLDGTSPIHRAASKDSKKILKETSNENSINSFKFNFQVSYYGKIEQLLYPESVVVYVRRCDGLKDYSVQRSGRDRAVCLICGCELKHPYPFCKVNKNIILNHVHGQRHLKNSLTPEILSALKRYHETFIRQELFIQSHSAYFLPDSDAKVKCILCCGPKISLDKVAEHVVGEFHKKKVIEIAKQMLLGKVPKLFAQDLIDIQLNHYGVTIEVEKPKEVQTKSNIKNNDVGTNRKDSTPKKKQASKSQSDSSSSSDNQKGHNIIKSIINPNGKELPDILPYRFKEHIPFFSKTGGTFRCNKCEKGVGSTSALVKKHIQSAQHLSVTKTTLPNYSYFCEICNITFANETLWDGHFENRIERHNSMAASRKEKVAEYECTVCMLVIFGDDISLIRHAPKKQDKQKKKDLKLPDRVSSLFKSRQVINATGESLRREANEVLTEQDPTWICCKVLEKVLSEIYPDCSAHPFGSRISGFGNKDSDLDVFIDTGGMYLGDINQDSKSQITFVNKSRMLFGKYKEEFSHIVPIPSARTPIVKLLHKRTDLDCDISFRHGLSVENTKFLKYFTKVQPSLQMLVLLLKKWSYFCGFDENITTYAFAMLAIFYMQVRNYLPSVVMVRNINPTPSLIIDGWIAFDDTLPPEHLKPYIKECHLDLKDLLKDFFSYYANFDYKKNVVCPLLGKTIEKSLFTLDGSLLPEEMMSYVQKLNYEEDPEIFRSRSEFCIQDPFDLTHNLTKACPGSVVDKLKKLCDLSFKHLEALD